MPNPSVGQPGHWRVTVLVNEHGSMVADRGHRAPGVREMDVMPVAEHEALRDAARKVVERCGEQTDDEGWTMAWVDAEALAALKAVLHA